MSIYPRYSPKAPIAQRNPGLPDCRKPFRIEYTYAGQKWCTVVRARDLAGALWEFQRDNPGCRVTNPPPVASAKEAAP